MSKETESVTPQPNPGDIVVISTDGLSNDQAYKLVDILRVAGFKGSIAGIEYITDPEDVGPGQSHLIQEVRDWASAYGDKVRPGYLEEVVIADELSTSKTLITEDALRKTFDEMYGPSSSTSISAGYLYKRVINAIDELFDDREYLQNGTVFMGERIKGPGYKWHQRHWGITPEALYGLTLENESITEFGATTISRIQSLLAHITDADMPVEHIRGSGWLGFERHTRVS